MENAPLHSIVQNEALTDPLISLPNRRAFDVRLAEEIRRSARYGHTFYVRMLDLDQFKRINDAHGHLVGDAALQEIACMLRSSIRDTDSLARYGGDEFVLILPETKADDADLIVQKLHAAIKTFKLPLPGAKIENLAISIGAALFPQDGTAPAELVLKADQRLYSKKKRRN